jgi:hypothetical protein
VAASVTQFPVKSNQKRSAEFAIPQSTMMDHMKLDLKAKPFHPLHVNELSDADMNAWKDACRALLAVFRSQHAHDAVPFTDECTIYWSVHSRSYGLRRTPIFMKSWR